MAIAFTCECGSGISVPDHLAGKKGKCPKCGKALVVPTKAAAKSAEPKPALAPGTNPAEAKPAVIDAKPVEGAFAVASSDLTASKDVVVSGEVISSSDATSSSDTTAPASEPVAPAKAEPAAKPAAKAPVTAAKKEASMRFRCPHCKATLTVPLRVAGQTGKCAACKQTFTAPVPEAVKKARARAGQPAATAARAAAPSLRDAFSVIKVKCWGCGTTSAVPKARVQGGNERCPACDRPLDLDESVEDEAAAED